MALTRRSWLENGGDHFANWRSARWFPAGRAVGAVVIGRTPQSHEHAMGTVGRVTSTAVKPTARICAPGTSRTCREPARPTSIAKPRDRTDRCCGSTRSSPSIARSRSRPGLFFPAWTYNGQVPGPDDSRHRGRPGQGHVQERGHASAHDALSRMASAGDGRRPPRSGSDAGRDVRVRVRRRSVWPAPLSLPHRAAEAAHPQGTVRRVHHRSATAAVRRPTRW